MIEEQLKAFDSAIESARLLGRAESRKERGSYTEDDARFEVSMHQSIAKHRAAILASSQPAPQQKSLTDEQIDRVLSAPIPGGSVASHWFLPHDTEQGLKNVRGVVRALIEAANNIGEKK